MRIFRECCRRCRSVRRSTGWVGSHCGCRHQCAWWIENCKAFQSFCIRKVARARFLPQWIQRQDLWWWDNQRKVWRADSGVRLAILSPNPQSECRTSKVGDFEGFLLPYKIPTNDSIRVRPWLAVSEVDGVNIGRKLAGRYCNEGICQRCTTEAFVAALICHRDRAHELKIHRWRCTVSESAKSRNKQSLSPYKVCPIVTIVVAPGTED